MRSELKVPFLDVGFTNASCEPELSEAIDRVVASGWFVLGSELEAFETELASSLGVSHAVGVGSGLDALVLTLEAAGIGPGDEVIVPSHTFIATWLAVTRVGAKPVPVEPDPATFTVDGPGVEAAVTRRTAAVIPVHLYGRPAPMAEIGLVADKHGLLVLADGAQSVGAKYRGAPVESWGTATALSFYPGKNLGALGDGGAVLTSDENLASRIRRLRNYGSEKKYEHLVPGFNSRLDEMQAAALSVKLHHLSNWNDRRRSIARSYARGLQGSGLQSPPPDTNEYESVWHLYVVRAGDRTSLQRELAARGVETLVHYPTPPHRQKAYADHRGSHLAIADEVARTVLSLPMGPHLTDEMVEHVAECVRSTGPMNLEV